MTPRVPSANGWVRDMTDASWVMHSMVPSRLMFRTRSHSLRMWGVPSLPMVRTAVPVPAQLTAMRSGASSADAATASATWSASVTSHLTNFTPSSLAIASPRSALKSTMVTAAPAPCRRRTVASPSPEAPPLTIAAAPFTSMAAQIRDGTALPPHPQYLPGHGGHHGQDVGRRAGDARVHPAEDPVAGRPDGGPRQPRPP